MIDCKKVDVVSYYSIIGVSSDNNYGHAKEDFYKKYFYSLMFVLHSCALHCII